MTSHSLFFWELIKPLKLIQFPWRLLFLSNLSLTVVCAFILNKFNFKNIFIFSLIFLSLSISYFFNYSKYSSLISHDKYYYLEYPFTSSTANELRTTNFNVEQNSLYKERLKDNNNYAKFDIKKWETAYHEYEISSTQSAEIIEHLMYFPDGKHI
jgi:hypothetical protein